MTKRPDERLRAVGIHGSPYSRKLLAALRYRRIPYSWIVKDSPEDHDLPQPRVVLMPQLITTDSTGTSVAVTDSTPMLRDLDRKFPGRELRPVDPVLGLLDALLEDWGDEWLTKCMFHYRWAFEPDIAQASAILPRWSLPMRPDDLVKAGGAMFAKRQISRLGVVGSNPITAPVIEDSYRRALLVLSDHLANARFLLGARPAACDFAVYGQLTQLVGVEPTSRAIAYSTAPRVVAWIDVMEELSGLEPGDSDWMARDRIPATMNAVLREVGRTYVPFLLANAAAIAAGSKTVECSIDGKPWSQQTFPYQAKCLGWLREEYAALSPTDRRDADAILAGTGCEAVFA